MEDAAEEESPTAKRPRLEPTPPSSATMGLSDWAGVISRVKSAIVAIRVTAVRPFEDSAAGVWHGTGFVVSLERPKEALMLTNRHIISTGPIRAFATFDGHEELPVFPVYRDPVHDFGFLQFDATQLRFTPRAEIPLDPEGLRVGAEVLVIGNDNVEKIQILPATIGRTDRNCPEYDDGNYQDENTFYAGAGSNTSGGSSGSPVIDRAGSCIALNAGGASEAASAFYLPLERPLYVLNWLRKNPSSSPLPPRGTILTRFLFQPFDMLRRLGFTKEQEDSCLEASKRVDSKDKEPLKGLLVVESFLPGSEAEEQLRPGDVLLDLQERSCPNFATMEAVLDSFVGQKVQAKISRAGKIVELSLSVSNLHSHVPHDFVECGGGVFHLLSYHTCKRFHLPVNRNGIFVAQSGFGFGLELPYHAVIASVAGKEVTSLQDFGNALAAVADNETFEVCWFNPTTNERRHKRSSVRMERGLWPLCVWQFKPERPNTWHREALPAAAPPAAEPVNGAAAPASAAAEAPASSDKPQSVSPSAGVDEESLGYPVSKDPTIAHVQPMLCTVTTRCAHENATDFIQSEEERGSTLIRRHGVGLVIDAKSGLVLTDRYVVPQPLMYVELTFAQMLTIDAVCLFVHPQHNVAVLRYDPAAVAELPVRSVDIWQQDAEAESGKAKDDAKPYEDLAIGDVLTFVSLHGDHRLSAKRVTVGSVYLKSWAFAEPPAYRERNLEICNLNDTLQGLGGLLVEPGPEGGRIRAWFAQFPAGKKHYIAGIASQVVAGILGMIGLGPSGWSGPVSSLANVQLPALDCEFEEVSVAKARRYHGMPADVAKEILAHCSAGRRQALMVSRVTAGGECDGQLQEGDVLLQVSGKTVTRMQEVEHLCAGGSSSSTAAANKPTEAPCTVTLKVLRSRQPVETKVRPSVRRSDGTERILIFNGMVMRPTLRAVAERGGPVLPHTQPGQGLYFWYIFPGSPADTFGVTGPGWLVQVDDEPTPSIERLLELIASGTFRGREWLRCRTVDSEGRPTVRALQPDRLFWPTVELVRRHGGATLLGAASSTTTATGGTADMGPPRLRWTRVEHPDPAETAAGTA
eukprot:TRINITY_DN64701_c0_g1_i1.p1 TRINITY_DN64701_c0_g1~~TRINITY_DN64701_c0_g1_i1.p1  ORF type:complete len:1087 (+),score=246.26 TRINITY_DN64701_c0_g1_i1:172-3432(+)